MGSKHSRPSTQSTTDAARPRASRAHGGTAPVADEISAEARAEFTVADIHCPNNTRRAQTLWTSDNDRFCKYRNYFKNHHMSLAREVGRKTSKSKAALLQWVEDAVGPLHEGDKLTKDEILEIAMVSAALTEYTEAALAKMYARGELNALPNVPLHTHNMRMPATQQACRNSSNAANKDKLEAAHYIGLEVMLRLNERLPVERRMGDELRQILNHSSNLRLMLATSNQVLHKKVDAMLINAKEAVDTLESTTATQHKQAKKISTREYDRLVQIAKHAQDDIFQDAMIAANGRHLYVSLRQQFILLDIGDRPVLWDLAKDKPELQQPVRSRLRSPSPVRGPRLAPPSPAKKRDPESRIRNNAVSSTPASTEKHHRNPFSRLAAKIFRSRHKKKEAQASVPAMTTREISSEPPRSVAPARSAKTNKKKPLAKTKATPQTKNANKPKPSRAKRNPRPPVAAKKTAKQSVSRSSQESSYRDSSSSDGSDYTDADVVQTDDRVYHVGPRGGKYYINEAGKKVYAKEA
ncbi:unnamed protein product [Hyaloperonospora brassicae]|uniref:Uncharacterized protein n=1 Tax=Hyaloperonospora brassicae TaxID=162125 RepID=A0AAV0UHS9_HYABA|nr:unnamed protein product [Hyaloperonospora brassicae]